MVFESAELSHWNRPCQSSVLSFCLLNRAPFYNRCVAGDCKDWHLLGTGRWIAGQWLSPADSWTPHFLLLYAVLKNQSTNATRYPVSLTCPFPPEGITKLSTDHTTFRRNTHPMLKRSWKDQLHDILEYAKLRRSWEVFKGPVNNCVLTLKYFSLL